MMRTARTLGWTVLLLLLGGCSTLRGWFAPKPAAPTGTVAITEPPFTIDGQVFLAINTATEDFRADLTAQKERAGKPEMAAEIDDNTRAVVDCITRLDTYDVEVAEDDASFTIHFRIHPERCTQSTGTYGGGASYQVRKADFTLVKKALPE